MGDSIMAATKSHFAWNKSRENRRKRILSLLIGNLKFSKKKYLKSTLVDVFIDIFWQIASTTSQYATKSLPNEFVLLTNREFDFVCVLLLICFIGPSFVTYCLMMRFFDNNFAWFLVREGAVYKSQLFQSL